MGFIVLSTNLLEIAPRLEEWLEANDSLITTIVLVCSYQLTRVIDQKETERIVDKAFELNDRRFEPVLVRMSEQYGLTARELDVLRLLVKGMTRPAICEELCVSANTVRTHTWRNDELMAIIETASRDYIQAR